MTIEEAIRILRKVSDINSLGKAVMSDINYFHNLNEACKIAADELRKRQWISVKDRLPEDGKDVLCWYEYFRYGNYNRLFQTYGIGYQFNGHWGGEVAQGRQAKVIAWQPLPEGPKEG